MSEMKYSGSKWIGDIPKSWKMNRLRYNCSFKTGGTPPDKEGINDIADGYPWITAQDMNNGLYIKSYSQFITEYSRKKCNYKLFPKGSILLVCIASVGKMGYLLEEAYSNQQITALMPNKTIEGRYLLYLINSLNPMIVKDAASNVVPIINTQYISNIKCCVPNLKEQELIVNFLDDKVDCIDKIIHDLNRQIEILNKYRFSLITEKVSSGLTDEKKEFLTGRLGLYSFVTKISGFEYTDVMADNLTDKGGIPVVRAQNVRMLKFDSDINEFIDLKTSLKLERCSLNKKCLLLTFIGAGIGDICIFDKKERYHLAPNVAKIEINNRNKLMEEYVMYYFASEYGKNEIFNITKASAQPSLSMETIRRLKIFIPPINEQKEIVDYLDNKCNQIDKIIEEKKFQIEKMEKYRKSVIYEYVTGKKRVKGAEELYG